MDREETARLSKEEQRQGDETLSIGKVQLCYGTATNGGAKAWQSRALQRQSKAWKINARAWQRIDSSGSGQAPNGKQTMCMGTAQSARQRN